MANHLVVAQTVVTGLAFWISIFKPLATQLIEVQSLASTLFATALTALVTAEAISKRGDFALLLRACSAMFFAVTAGLLVPFLMTSNTTFSIAVLVLNVLCLWWIGLSNRDQNVLAFARVFIVGSALLVGNRFFHESLFSSTAWATGAALWSLATMCWAIVSTCWLMRTTTEFASGIGDQSVRGLIANRIGWKDASKQRWDVLSLSALVQLAIGVTILGSMLGFAVQVVAYAANAYSQITSAALLPAAVLLFAAIGARWYCRRYECTGTPWDQLLGVQLAGGCLWIGWQAGLRMVVDPATQIVIATSLASVACFLIELFRKRESAQRMMSSIGMATIVGSSLSLLDGDWLPAILERGAPDVFLTATVATWWIVGAGVAIWVGYRDRSATYTLIASVFVPAIVVVISPLFVVEQWWVWVQAAAVTSGVLLVLSDRILEFDFVARWIDDRHRQIQQPSRDLSFTLCVSVGTLTAVGVTAALLFGVTAWEQLHSVTGVTCAVMAAILVTFWKKYASPAWKPNEFPRLVAPSFLAGHFALLISAFWTGMGANWILIALWLVAAALVMFESYRTIWNGQKPSSIDRWHATILIGVVAVYCVVVGVSWEHFTMGLIASGLAGLLAIAETLSVAWSPQVDESLTRYRIWYSRSIGWFALVAGSVFAVRLCDAIGGGRQEIWTCVLLWFANWIVLWRVTCPDRSSSPVARMLPDRFASTLVLFGLLFEVAWLSVSPTSLAAVESTADPLFWLRIGTYIVFVAATCFRLSSRDAIVVGVLTLLGAGTLLTLRLAVDQAATTPTQCSLAALSIATCFTVIVFT
ncbi:MAG: hypothetical protein AAF497_13700, partial [Planctomycetota bacterium]